jgi:hypothetical protein
MYVDANSIVAGGVSATGVVTFQTITGAAAVLSTNTLDLLQRRDMGSGEDLYLRVEVGTAFAGLTSMDVEAITADDAALTTNVTCVGALKAVPLANLGAGARIAIDLSPLIGSTGRRYLGARFTPNGTGTAGSVIADFGIEVQEAGDQYPVGFSVI